MERMHIHIARKRFMNAGDGVAGPQQRAQSQRFGRIGGAGVRGHIRQCKKFFEQRTLIQARDMERAAAAHQGVIHETLGRREQERAAGARQGADDGVAIGFGKKRG